MDRLAKLWKKMKLLSELALRGEQLVDRTNQLADKAYRLVNRNIVLQNTCKEFAQDLIRKAPPLSPEHEEASAWLWGEYGFRCDCGQCFKSPPN